MHPIGGLGFGICLGWVVFLTFATSNEFSPRQKGTGTLTGTIRYAGKARPPEVTMTTDGGTIKQFEVDVDQKTKGLRYVLVQLEDGPKQIPIKNGKPVLMDQKDMVFLPRVLAVQLGQPVYFDNSDLCNHSVQSSSIIPADQFNVFTTPGRPVKHVFAAQKSPVRIGCSLHPWMRAWVFVIPHPWFAVSDAQGKFEIKDIPEGKYSLKYQHPDTGKMERRAIHIEAGKTTKLDLEWKDLPDKRGR